MIRTNICIQNENVPRIGQGCMGIGGRFSQDISSDAEQIRALQLGIDLGMSFIDTAEVYGAGHSEKLIGRAIEGRRGDVFIASKVMPEHLALTDIMTACEESLNRLKVGYLNLYQIHWPNPTIPIEETLEGMIRLKEQGKIRHIGLSNFSLAETIKVQKILSSVPLFSVQLEYNLFDRGAEEKIIPWCSENGVLFIAYSPLDQGQIVGNSEVRGRLDKIADRLGRTSSQVALNFLTSRGPVLAIPKATHSGHIKENSTSCDFTITAMLLDEINRACRVGMTLLPWRKIRPAIDVSGEHKVYTTLEEALANPAAHSPSPLELSKEIQKDDRIKPIRVTPIIGYNGEYNYDLVEGRLRFWAWVLAFNGLRDVPVLIRD